MKFEEWLQDLKDSFEYVNTEEELMAFLKKIELTLVKGQVIAELPSIYLQEPDKEVKNDKSIK